MKKAVVLIAFLILIIILLFVSFSITKETVPSKDTRIILEHTHETYIAPPCFEQSGATNFIEDADLDEASELNYPPHDTCTEEALQGEEEPLFISLLKDIGLIEKKWDGW